MCTRVDADRIALRWTHMADPLAASSAWAPHLPVRQAITPRWTSHQLARPVTQPDGWSSPVTVRSLAGRRNIPADVGWTQGAPAASCLGTGSLLAVGDSYAPGADVRGDLIDARVHRSGRLRCSPRICRRRCRAVSSMMARRICLLRYWPARIRRRGWGCRARAWLTVAWKRRSHGALPTTVTELVAMATAASAGGRIPAAASRTSSRLQPKGHRD